jgi:nitrite reductase/ring-hydroxylating ferredoxin subunit
MAAAGTGRDGKSKELPDSLLALGEGLHASQDVTPDPALFADAAVFAAERARVFARTAIIAEHAGRLPADGCYCVLDTGARSLVLTRESAERLHALGNICLHAGYPVCEAEEGSGERLRCPYHDWEYALDGRLVYPALSPERYDPARLRLKSYPLAVCRGLILVDLAGSAPPALERAAALPSWLDGAVVTARTRLAVERNWKHLRAILPPVMEPVLGGPPAAPLLSVGALSLFAIGAERAVILRLIPHSPLRTDLLLIGLAAGAGNGAAFDKIAEALAAAPVPRLDRRFFEWYWSLIL